MVDLVLQSWLNHFFKLTFFHCFIAFFIWAVIAIVLLLHGLSLLQRRISEIYILERDASPSLLPAGVQSQIHYGVLILSQPYGLLLLRHPTSPCCTTSCTVHLKLYGSGLRPQLTIMFHYRYVVKAGKITLHMLIILHDSSIHLASMLELHAFATDQLLFTLPTL